MRQVVRIKVPIIAKTFEGSTHLVLSNNGMEEYAINL